MFNLKENSTINGAGLTVVSTAVVFAGIDVIQNGGDGIIGILLVAAGLVAMILGTIAAARKDEPKPYQPQNDPKP